MAEDILRTIGRLELWRGREEGGERGREEGGTTMDGRESRAKMDGERELGAWHVGRKAHGRVGERVGWMAGSPWH